MIGRVAGRIEHRGADHVLIDVRGVGYIIYVSDRTLAGLPGVGEAAALFTDLLVREDLLQLFGFPTLIEKEWHRLLMTVQGIGAKASMAILGSLGAEGVARAVALADVRAIQAAPGVGPKIAQRVVLELKAKAPALMAMAGAASATRVAVPDAEVVEDAVVVTGLLTGRPRFRPGATPGGATPGGATGGGAEAAVASAEALSALTNLGYGQGDAAGAVAEASGAGQGIGTAALIRAALKLLAPR